MFLKETSRISHEMRYMILMNANFLNILMSQYDIRGQLGSGEWINRNSTLQATGSCVSLTTLQSLDQSARDLLSGEL